MQPVTTGERRVLKAYQQDHCKYSMHAVNRELVKSVCSRCFTTLANTFSTCHNCFPTEKRRSARLNSASPAPKAAKSNPKMDIAYLLN